MKKIPYPLPKTWVFRRYGFRLFYPLDITDSEGRSLLESRSHIFSVLPTDRVICRYNDSRFNSSLPMNSGALKLFAKNNKAVNLLINKIVSILLEKYPTFIEKDPISRIAIISYVGWTLPLYRTVCGGFTYPAEAAFSKACHGILSGCKHLHKEKLDLGISTGRIGEMFYEHVVRHGLLRGRNEVCAASPKMIIDIVDEMASLTPRCLPDDPSEINNVVQFCLKKRELEIILIMFEIARITLYINLGVNLQNIKFHYAFPFQKEIRDSFIEGRHHDLLVQNFKRYCIYNESICQGSFLLLEIFSLISARTFKVKDFLAVVSKTILYLDIYQLNGGKCPGDDYHYNENDLGIFLGPLPEVCGLW